MSTTPLPAHDGDALIAALRARAEWQSSHLPPDTLDLLRAAADRLAAANAIQDKEIARLIRQLEGRVATDPATNPRTYTARMAEDDAKAAAALTSLSARLAEVEREASEERRLIGDLRARIATLTEALTEAREVVDTALENRPSYSWGYAVRAKIDAALHPEKAAAPLTEENPQ